VIIGIGVDLVDISRFEVALQRTPALAARLFTQSERCGRPESLAASFAAKEAVAKAMGAPTGLSWTDVEVIRDATGCPRLEIRGTVADAASQRGIRHWHVSLSHDAGVSIAMVVAEG
jgi:holo-[acyl-carrier protein] synthase